MARDPKAVAKDAAEKLRAAMKGWGTDEKALIRVVVNLNANELKLVHEAYKAQHDRDLMADIKDETSGCFEDALVALLTPALPYDAQLLRKSMAGLGTNEDLLIEMICTRSLEELTILAKEYKTQYGHDLEEDIRDETSGDLKRLLVQRLKTDDAKGDIDNDVDLLYKAGQGRLGTDEAVFVTILGHRTRDYIKKLNTAYANKYGKSLQAVVESECSGDFKRALLALVTPVDEYLGTKLFKAMDGVGTDDKTLIRIIATQRYRFLPQIAAWYLGRHNKSLKAAIESECSGDYKKLMVAVCERFIENKVIN